MTNKWVEDQRRLAWARGRELREQLLEQYCHEYGLEVPPPPARVIDELLTEIVQVRLRYDPLPPDRFAETRLVAGEITVTVNSNTGEIEGVKHIEGVQNVGKWHEAIHVVDHRDVICRPVQAGLPGFGEAAPVVCYRAPRYLQVRDDKAEREFWAEEAGRAAAVSLPALQRTRPFQAMMKAASATGPTRGAWGMLYDAAAEIGVNISALTKQLEYEGIIHIVDHGGRGEVLVQAQLLESER